MTVIVDSVKKVLRGEEPMPTAIPLSFQSTPENNARYCSERAGFLPLLSSKARVVAKSGLFDATDLLQEMEIAALYGMSVHDPAKSTLLSWVGYLADRVAMIFLRHALSSSRMPYLKDEVNGQVVLTPAPVVVFDEKLEREFAGAGEKEKDEVAAEFVRARFRAQMDRRLEGLARQLFWAKVNPSLELLIFVRNRTGQLPESPEQLSLEMIAEYHGHDKTAGRLAWQRVKDAMRAVALEFEPEDRALLGVC